MLRPALLAAVVAASGGLYPPLAQAGDRPDPLRCVPATAQFVLAVDHPRQLAEAVLGLRAVRDAQGLAPVRQVLDGATARRFYQMLGYLERELGADWPALLDQLAGGGMAVGGRFGDKAPAVLVVQGTDEGQTAKAFALFGKILDDELARQGSPAKVARGTDGGADTLRLGDDLHAARAGAVLLLSNQADALKAALDLTLGRGDGESVLGKKTVADARKLLPTDPLARVWVDFASVKQDQATRDFLETTKKDFLGNLVVGGTVDGLRRSDFVAAGLYREATGFRLAVRLPAGRGDAPVYALHTPPAGKPGSLPLLEPPGVVYSQSFYLDFARAWADRKDLFNDDVIGQFEKAEKDISKFLPGSVKLGELVGAWGPYHRLVVVNQDVMPYQTRPGQLLPGFGYVATMADPKFGTAVGSAARAGGLLAGLQFGLKQSEVEYDGVKIVAYRFREDKPIAEDADGLRFNFEPCFAAVGDQFVAASTVEVCKKLIAEVKRTAAADGGPAVWRAKGFAAAAGDAVYAVPEPFVTDFVLRYGVGAGAARKQVEALTAWAKTLGTVRVEIDQAATDYRFDIVWEHR